MLVGIRTILIIVHLLAISVGGIVVVGIEYDVSVIGVEPIYTAVLLVFVIHAKVSFPFSRESNGTSQILIAGGECGGHSTQCYQECSELFHTAVVLFVTAAKLFISCETT